MSSNLKICIDMPVGKPIDELFKGLRECALATGFQLHESANDVCERGRKIGKGGHLAFVICLQHSDGPVTVWFKFKDYGLVDRIVFEPGNHLWAGATDYIERDYWFILALHKITKMCFEELDAEAATAILDDVLVPWFRFSRMENHIPLPEILLECED